MPRSVKASLLRSYRKLLRPLVRILIRNGVGLSELQLTVADAFMEEAVRQLPKGTNYTDEESLAAKIGFDANLLRKLVSMRVAEDTKDAEFERECVSKVLDAWHSEPGYSGVYGITYDISENEFVELCNKSAPGLGYGRIAELMHSGGCLEVEKNENGDAEYRCVSNIYRPEPLSDPQIDILADRVTNLVTTLDNNLHAKDAAKRIFESHVWTADGLSSEQLEEFDQRIREKFQEVLDSIDAWFTSQAHARKRLQSSGEDLFKTGVNVFHYVKAPEEEVRFRDLLAAKGIGTTRRD